MLSPNVPASMKLVLHMVDRIHVHLQGSGIKFLDLVAAGAAGYAEAERQFDEMVKNKITTKPFGTVAAVFIQESILGVLPVRAKTLIPAYIRKGFNLGLISEMVPV